jgi:peptidylprolyl isomerase
MKGLDPTPPLSRTNMGNGLIIEDLKMGTGEVVWPEGKARLSIKGWSVATGQLYWDTATQGGPRDIELAKAMKGIREGVPGMRVGGKRRLTIPADKAYGFKEVMNDKDEIVVPLATPIVLEIEAIEALTKLRIDSPAGSEAAPAKNDFSAPR